MAPPSGIDDLNPTRIDDSPLFACNDLHAHARTFWANMFSTSTRPSPETIDATELTVFISIDRDALPRTVGPFVDVFQQFSFAVRAYAYYTYNFLSWRNGNDEESVACGPVGLRCVSRPTSTDTGLYILRSELISKCDWTIGVYVHVTNCHMDLSGQRWVATMWPKMVTPRALPLVPPFRAVFVTTLTNLNGGSGANSIITHINTHMDGKATLRTHFKMIPASVNLIPPSWYDAWRHWHGRIRAPSDCKSYVHAVLSEHLRAMLNHMRFMRLPMYAQSYATSTLRRLQKLHQRRPTARTNACHYAPPSCNSRQHATYRANGPRPRLRLPPS
jgi:hypothetical protein